MPLLIDFKSGDKIIINGAVIENSGAASKLLIHNRAAILRGREVLSEEEIQTPASRVYFALQCAYMFVDKKDDYLKLFRNFLADYVAACPSAKPIADKIFIQVEKDHLYKGLKATHDLVRHESETLQTYQQEVKSAADSQSEDSSGEKENKTEGGE